MKRFEFTLSAQALRTSEKVHLTANFLSMDFAEVGSTETVIGMSLQAVTIHILCNQTLTFWILYSHNSFRTENAVVHSIVDCEVTERDDGKQYVNVKNVRSTIVSVGRFSMKYESPNVMPLVTGTVNRLINVNWRIFFVDVKPQLESTIGDVIKSFIVPIFSNIPMQDLYVENK